MNKLSEKLKELPKQPGVYQFLDAQAGVIYVGKAKNLRARVRQYFAGEDDRPQIPFLMREATDFNYTVVSNELESAFLENTLIKQYKPKYNIDLRDDKNYAFITIDYSCEIPQIGYERKFDPQNKKIKYFGPYSAVYKIRQTLNLVRRIFPYCAAQKVSNRPCFYYYLHRCPGVCIGKISLDNYKQQLHRIAHFLQGEFGKVKKELAEEMKLASSKQQFEKAARLRDQCNALETLEERQNVILPKQVDWDLVSLAASNGYACVNLFKIRYGKMFDKENFVYEIPDFLRRHSEGVQPTDLSAVALAKEEESQNQVEILRPQIKTSERTQDDAMKEVLQRFLEQYYLEASSQPKVIYTETPATDPELVEHILNSRFNKKTKVLVPQKGQLKSLINLGSLNAEQYLSNWLNDKAGNLDKINKALEELKTVLDLPNIPKRIECYDISNTQGTNPVGSMVVFVDGLPAKSQYRKFKIQSKKTPDDFAMMREMLSRRFARIKNQKLGIKEKDAWPMPDLIVIDGGKGQLGVAVEVLEKLKVESDKLKVIGLAKRIEEIFLPGSPEPIILPHDNPALQLLQRLRDEAHRFGITFHRKLRSKQAIKSALDDIPGIGPITKKLLKQKFGTVGQIKKTPFDELVKVVGERIAELLQKSL